MPPRLNLRGVWAAGFGLAILAAAPPPAAAQSAAAQPTYADGVIHCPDGSTHDYRLGVPEPIVMHLACRTRKVGTAAVPPPVAVDDLPSLRHPLSNGNLRCPDGSTRPWEGAPPSDLTVKMACDVPADVAAENNRRVQGAWDEKNAEGKLRAALRGEAGVWAGLKASWDARSLDYLLSFRATWFIGIALLLFGLIRIFRKK